MVQITISRRHLVFLLSAVVVLVVAIPLAVSAATSMFADVSDDHIFVDDINWMKTAGVTQGCGDGTNYCPEDDVTRGQMAAFMHRLATKRVVDAGTLDGKNSTAFVSNPLWISNTQNLIDVAAGAWVSIEAECPAPRYVISGGGQPSHPDLVMVTSRPMTDNRRWRVTWMNTGATTISAKGTIWAMCAGPGTSIVPIP